jgi:RHS repeat-associated protein
VSVGVRSVSYPLATSTGVEVSSGVSASVVSVGVVVAAKPVGVTATRFYRHGTALVGVRSGSTGTAVDGLSWVVTDRQGTVTATVPAGSTSGSVNRYRPFGVNRAGDAITATARGFLARHEDPDGLVATDHRLYDPSIGRFLTIDPLLDTTRDPYGYGAGNPVTWSDPSGLEACRVSGGGGCSWDPDVDTVGNPTPHRGDPSSDPSAAYRADVADGRYRPGEGFLRGFIEGFFARERGRVAEPNELHRHLRAAGDAAKTIAEPLSFGALFVPAVLAPAAVFYSTIGWLTDLGRSASGDPSVEGERLADDTAFWALSVYTLRPVEGVQRVAHRVVDVVAWLMQQDRDRPQRDKPAGTVCRSYAPGAEMGGGNTGC